MTNQSSSVCLHAFGAPALKIHEAVNGVRLGYSSHSSDGLDKRAVLTVR